ncbi:MAG TPA: pitrilysin family protein, partial [Acidobacteriota bacterium]|nr:pitrilysin family protein [Acidobacteriota bacterium]
SIAGSIPTVMGLTRRHLADHRRLFYRPDRILIAACGKLSHDRLVRQARQMFQFEAASEPAPDIVSPNGVTMRCGVDQRDIKQTHVCLGFPTWRFADKRRHTTLLTSSLLGGGMSSRLFQSVREKRGLVYAIYTFSDALYDTGFFGVYFACDPAQLINATNVILDEMGRLTRTAVTRAELADTKAQLRGNLLMGLESIPPRMHRLARHELYLGGHVPAEQTLRSINRIKAADITAFANEAFRPDRLAMAVLGPVQSEILTKVALEKLRPAKRRRKKE